MSISHFDSLRALLELERVRRIDAVLDKVLFVLLKCTGIPYGYVEVLNEHADPPTLTWRARASGDDHMSTISKAISRGIIGRARVEGRTISTSSAIEDTRFADLSSVRAHEIGPVICAPFDGFWTSGVIYLQGDAVRAGLGSSEFDVVELVQLAARQLGLIAERDHRQLKPQLSLDVEVNAVKRHAVEEALRRHDWNLSAVEREIGLGRACIRRLMRRGSNK